MNPKCPICGARAALFDRNGVWWLCAKCEPSGRYFSVSQEEAERHARAFREQDRALRLYVNERYAPGRRPSEIDSRHLNAVTHSNVDHAGR